jgi:hypothetical protein
MLAIATKLFAGSVSVGSFLWFAIRNCAMLLLIIWTSAITVFDDSDMLERFLWVPVCLGFVAVFGAVFILAIPSHLIMAFNMATLLPFMILSELGNTKRCSPVAVTRNCKT